MKKIKVNRKFIAQKANVSTATVSYVLNDIPNSRVGKKTKKRVMEIAKKYDYFPNILARSLVMQKTFNIGFINTLPLVTFLGDSFQNSIFAGIESAIEKNGYSLLFSLLKYTDDIKDLNFSVKKMICGNIVDGIVLYGKVEPNLIEFLYQNNVQFILIDYFIDNIKTNSILPDNINGAFEATEHLIKQNLKNIYCINGKEKHPSYTERPAGYRKAMKKARLKPKVLNIGTRIEEAYIFTKKLIEKKDMPEAFFATGDNMAIGILRCLIDHGINVPGKIKVIGFDNSLHFERERIQLTTVNVPKIEMGEEAVKILLNQIKNNQKPEIYRLPAKLIVKETA